VKCVATVATSQRNTALSGERKFWLGFQRVPFIGPARIQRLVDRFESLEVAWAASAAELGTVLDERSVESLLRIRTTLSLDAEMERLDRLGIQIVAFSDPEYPYLLGQISAPPPVLYYKGSLVAEDTSSVAIVGTRRATAYGREVANQIATGLADAGVTIVSGLARGIDGVAHRAALKSGGRTLAILGSGVDVIYPGEHANLAEEIAANGAVISEHAPGTKPDAVNFPARNRIISGLSKGVVVIEAPVKSGALITCDFAADQGREVFAIPGSILSPTSGGCNRLLRDGARIATSAADILDDLNLGQRREQTPVQQSLLATDEQRRILALLTGEPKHIDDLAAAAGLSISQCSVALISLEMNGTVRNIGAQHYIRV
jgi:DNA processing protein